MDRNEFLAASRRLSRRIAEGSAPKPAADEKLVQATRKARRQRFEKLFSDHKSKRTVGTTRRHAARVN